MNLLNFHYFYRHFEKQNNTSRMNKPTAVIFNSDTQSGNRLVEIVKNQGLIEISMVLQDVETAIEQTQELKPAIIFLDLEKCGKKGLNYAEALAELPADPYLIFITHRPQEELDSFMKSGFGYVPKPVDPQKLLKISQRALCHISRKTPSSKLRFAVSSGYCFIDIKDILYIEAHGNYSDLYLTDGTRQTLTMQLGKLHAMLPQSTFFRVSRSALINTTYLKFINKQKMSCVVQYRGINGELRISKEALRNLKTLHD